MSTITLEIEKKKTLAPSLRFREFEEEWKETLLNDVAEFRKGKGISKSDINEEGNLECIRYGELYTTYTELISDVVSKTDLPLNNLELSQYNDVIIPASGETQLDIATASCVLKSGVALSGDLNIIRSTLNGIFLSFYLNNKKKLEIAKLAQGSSVVHLYSSQLKNLKLNIPTLPEQQKIASFLSAVDEKTQQLSRKKELLEQYKKGVMQQLFSGKLRFKDENGEDYPDWEEKKLGELVTLMQSGISRMLSDTDIGLPIIRSNNLQNGRIDITDIKYWFEIDNQGTNLENYVLTEGDLLVNFINSIAQIGKVAIFSDLMKRKTIFTTNLLRLRFNHKTTSHFMINYFHLKKYENFIQSITKPAVNQASFTTKDFRTFIVNLPSLTEQQKIADFLSSIDIKIESMNQQLAQAQIFKKGLLQKMFV